MSRAMRDASDAMLGAADQAIMTMFVIVGAAMLLSILVRIALRRTRRGGSQS